jgi:seryl-tRNA synthetase
MSARDLARGLESYLEADDTRDSSNGTDIGNAVTSSLSASDTRQQLRQLTQTNEQLKQDVKGLQQEIAGLKNNMQMSMLLPMLTNKSETVVSNLDKGGTAVNWVDVGTVLTTKPTDALTMMLPALLLSGSDASGIGGSDNSTMMMVLALALSK